MAAEVRISQWKVQLGFILNIQRLIKDHPSLGMVWGSTAENDCGGSKQGMGEVQHLGLCVLNFLEILVWAEHSLEGLGNSHSTGGGKCRPWKACRTARGAARLLMEPWAHPH